MVNNSINLIYIVVETIISYPLLILCIGHNWVKSGLGSQLTVSD